MSFTCTDLDSFLSEYGSLLAEKARQTLQPLHVPGRDKIELPTLLRKPFEAQSHVIMAAVKALRRQKAVQLICEMGTGKTMMAMSTIYAHAKQNFRALVVCPGQLVEKWAREITGTIPNAKVVIIRDWLDLMPLMEKWRDKGNRSWHMPICPEFYVIGRDRLKLSSGWKPAYQVRSVKETDWDGEPTGKTYWKVKVADGATMKLKDEGLVRCWSCGQEQHSKSKEPREEKYYQSARRHCTNEECKAPMYQETPKPRRYAPARLIQKHLRGFFEYLICDEAHEYKAEDTLQADALGGVASACKKVLALTGTLVGGYAWHVRTLLIRIGAGRTILGDGFAWSDRKKWSETYGRIEKTVKTKGDAIELESGYKFGRGGKKPTVTEREAPGIMPTMFKHLIWNSVFLSLEEVASGLPRLSENPDQGTGPQGCNMDGEQRAAYDFVSKALKEEMRDMVRKGDRRMLGMMLNVLLCYPDYPYDWGPIGYYDTLPNSDKKVFRHVVTPPNLDPSIRRPKEEQLVRLCLAEKREHRQTWVYVQYTDKRDCLTRLGGFLEEAGLKVKIMRANVKPADREAWIKQHGPGADVILSHPVLVQTGLDFFDWDTGHNFASIVFYQTGYNPFTLRQAARRAWRIGQRRECRVYYLFYGGSMQERALTLMGRKIVAALQVEGQFSAEGLSAMAGDDSSVEMALAKSLADNIQEEQATRVWAKVSANGEQPAEVESLEEWRQQEEFHRLLLAELAELGINVSA